MSTVAITLNGVMWTPLTSAGYSGICWLLIRPTTGRILLDHSSSGLGDIDEGKSYSIPDNKEVITELAAVNDGDIFYAKCSEAGEYAVVIVDDERLSDSGISNSNSTSTPLGIGEIFEGDWVPVTKYGIIFVNVATDADSVIDGLELILSSDGVNEDHIDFYTIMGGKHKNFAINAHSNYFKVRYTNGSDPQTYLRLQTKFNADGLASSHRIKDDITTDDDARLVKSILAIKANDQNEYKNIELNNPMPINSGQLYQSDFNLEHSDMGSFSGTAIDLIDDRWSTVVDNTATNPKVITLEFERALQTSVIGITTESGSFSNTVIKYGLATLPDQIIVDESTDSTPKTILLAPSIPLTLTRIILEFHTANTVTLTHLDMSKDDGVIAQIQGIDPDGELLTVGTSRKGNLNVGIQEYGDTSAIDAFASLRVSQKYTLFDSKQLHDKQPLFWDEIVGGAATSTHNPANACTEMVVTASASDYIIRQTKQRFNYQPGKGGLDEFTFYGAQQTGVKIQIGAFDGTGVDYRTPNNGIFLEITEDSISWNVAKNGTITESVEQADWNYDKLDGKGPSGIVLKPNAAIIGFFDFEWLGVGRIRCGYYIGGLPIYVHFFYHSNIELFNSVYMSTPNLPLRYYIESDGTGSGQLDHICSTVISEGGIEETGVLRSVDTHTTHIDADVADTTYAIVGIRLKSTHLDVTVIPEFFSMINESTDDFRWSLCLNPTIAGTFTYTDVLNSAVQYATGATANTVSNEGLVIDSGYAVAGVNIGGAANRKFVTSLRMGSTIAGIQDTIVLCATPLSASADMQGSLTFRELL